MTESDLVRQIVAAWRLNERIDQQLLAAIGAKGMRAVPSGSKSRNVAQVFAHMHKVRLAWLNYFSPASIAGIPRFEKGTSPGKPQLRVALRKSGDAVATMLERALRGEEKVKSFQGEPLRWIAYLISHDAHHRGQIALALKQSGVRLPSEVAIGTLWQQWYFGKD